MRLTRSPLVALALLAAGCTSTGYAPLNDPHGLVATDGIILLDDDHGTTLPVTPDSVVTFDTDDGWTEPVRAGRLCRSTVDLSVRTGDTCDGAFRLAPYDAIHGVHVETEDRAGTVAIASVATAFGLTILAAFTVLSPFKGVGKSSGSSKSRSRSSSSSSSSSSSASSGLTLKHPTGPGRPGAGYHHHSDTALRRGAEILTNVGLQAASSALMPSGSISYEGPEEAPPAPIEGPSFTAREVRRADVSVLASVDGAANPFGRDGLSTGAHVGLRIDDFVDLGIGGRWLDGGTSRVGDRVVPTAVLGLHGELPRTRWIAIGLAVEGGHGNDVDIYLDARFGVRFEPVRGLWIGVYPMHPSYFQWSNGRGDHWVPQSSADLAFGF